MNRRFFVASSMVLALVSGSALAQGDGAVAQGKATPEQIQKVRQQVQNLRQAVAAYQDASENGDQAGAATAAGQAHDAWNALPPRVRARIEDRHPGTEARLTGLKNQAAGSGAASNKNGTLTEDKTITGPKGGNTTVDKTWTKNGNTVTEQGTVTGPKGQTTTSKGTWTKSGNATPQTASRAGGPATAAHRFKDEFDVFGERAAGLRDPDRRGQPTNVSGLWQSFTSPRDAQNTGRLATCPTAYGITFLSINKAHPTSAITLLMSHSCRRPPHQ